VAAIDFSSGVPVGGDLNVAWIHGSADRKHPTDPAVQVHRYNKHTFMLRQSKDTTFEAPFVFLLFGAERALLLDSGAVKDATLRTAVDSLIETWLAEHPHPTYPLVVAHTHGHNDHIAGDPSFGDRPDTTVVGHAVGDVQSFFRFTECPAEVVPFDLGGRVLDVTGLPGHQRAAIAIYDRWTGLLFTGDSALPGRVYMRDVPAFVESIQRLAEFAAARPVTHVLGCHIEMTTEPGVDYFPGCRYQPDEPPLQMTVAQLRHIADAAQAAGGNGIHTYDDFVIYARMGPATNLRLIARSLAGSVRTRIRR
jgi:hydroxyacylglutathione hydrolase